jgi:hypothetical protein
VIETREKERKSASRPSSAIGSARQGVQAHSGTFSYMHTCLPNRSVQLSMDFVSSIVQSIPSTSRVHCPLLVGHLHTWQCPPPCACMTSVTMGRKDMRWSNRGGEIIQTKGHPNHPPPLFRDPFWGLLKSGYCGAPPPFLGLRGGI